MHPDHRKILIQLRAQKRRGGLLVRDRYLLSGHRYYGISVPKRRLLAQTWVRDNDAISHKEFFALLDSLYEGDSHEEKTLASMLLKYTISVRQAVLPNQIDRWLDGLVGWAEIDGLCANTFTFDDMQLHWDEWKRFIRKLSTSANINKRRASLVFLTGPLRVSNDPRVLSLAFDIIARLEHEKPIIITKAISWLLRSGVKNYKAEIASYLTMHASSLPKIAIWETKRKISTGRK